MRKIIGIVLVLCAFAGAVWSVPASRQPIVRILADGSRDTIYLHGDEYGSYRTDARGRLLSKGALPARAPQRQMLSSYVPSKGKVRVPVILVNFSDYSFTIENPIEQFDDLFNGKGGSNPNATGSVHDYYVASSDSTLDLEYYVFGVYTLSHEMEYYGANKKNSDGTVTNHNVRAKELVKEAVQLAANAGVDFTPFDNNNDGNIDNVSIVVAGYNEAEGGEERTIWPHYSTVDGSRVSNKNVTGYLMISEYRSSGGKVQAGIGTYCHEFGHALGLPDLYDTDSDKSYTIGEWDIMCSGSYNNNGSTPPSFTAFERFMMGWMTPTQVTSGMQVLQPIETSNQALLIADKTHNLNAFSPSPSEYFLLENRQAVGWDAGKEALVATGLLVSHVTFNKGTWDRNTFNNSTPLGFAIVSAGVSHPTKSSAADIFPGSTKRTSWIPMLNDGTLLSQLNVTQIRERADGAMSMQVGATDKLPLSFDREEVILQTEYLYNPTNYDTAVVNLLIDSLEQDTVRLIMTSRNFSFSADEGKSWHTDNDTAVLRVYTDSTYSIPVWVIHTPGRKNCNYVHAFFTAESENESAAAQMTLTGRAPRPVLITTPVIDSVTNVSTNSFDLYWTPQEDAECYYYTLYTLSEGESEEKDSLDVTFNLTGQSAQTSRTIYAPDKVSVRIDNTYTPNSVDSVIGGDVVISGSPDGTNWEKVTTIRIQRTTKNVVRTFELDTARHWRQFKLEYTHLGGYGGASFKEWTSHFGMNIHYVYTLEEYMIYTPGNDIVFRDLKPGTTYYYAMQAFEEKGCEPHYSELSAPISVTTKNAPGDPQLVVMRDDQGLYSVELPEMADGLHTLMIYDYTGRMVYSLQPAYGTTVIQLPALPIGQLYTLKYFKDKINRRDPGAKLLSY